MNTITRERLEQALVNPAKITFNYGETLELARIALASLGAEKIAEPVAKVETVGVCWYADNGVPRKPAVGTELYAAPPAPVVQEDLLSMAASAIEDLLEHTDPSTSYYSGVWADVPGKLRAAILQGAEPVSNRDELPDGWVACSERMPEREIDVQVYCSDKKEQMVGYMERNERDGYFRFASLPNGGGVYCQPTHWMPLPAAPQQEAE